MRSSAVSLRVITNCDTFLFAEAADHGTVDVDGVLFDIHHLEPSAIEPAHDLFVVLQARAFEETSGGALRGHAVFPIEYLAYDLVMTDGSAVRQPFCTQDDADNKPFDDHFES